jgi:hypothetical protein
VAFESEAVGLDQFGEHLRLHGLVEELKSSYRCGTISQSSLPQPAG